ncbi:unnamed protein product [Paramecium octaurelia]|uniref:Tetratricopeptide repeat protein n=1 Tax=Paramecium octaurelia TaxID=43137 RepID=A0A8S1VQL6_PAROT|nr:unnamed protein product [Paramecium octaurelia]
MNRFVEALAYQVSSIKKNTNGPENHINGPGTQDNFLTKKFLKIRKRLEESLISYILDIWKTPKSSDVNNSKGYVLCKQNRFAEALDYYDTAIQNNPDNPNYYIGKAISLMNLKRFEEANDYYDLAIDKNPGNTDYYIGKGIELESNL